MQQTWWSKMFSEFETPAITSETIDRDQDHYSNVTCLMATAFLTKKIPECSLRGL